MPKGQSKQEGRTVEAVTTREAGSSLQQNLSTEGTEKVKTSQFENNEASNLRGT